MNNKALIAVIALLLVGGGYWFYIDSQNKGTTDNARLAEGATAQDPNTVSDANMMQAGGEGMPTNNPAMNGTWKSKEDAKFTREFSADGTVTDRYEGDASATMTGTYMIVDPLKEPEGAFGNAPVASLTGMTIIRTTWPNSEIMYFGVQSLAETDLSLIHLSGRGNILSFTKVR